MRPYRYAGQLGPKDSIGPSPMSRVRLAEGLLIVYSTWAVLAVVPLWCVPVCVCVSVCVWCGVCVWRDYFNLFDNINKRGTVALFCMVLLQNELWFC